MPAGISTAKGRRSSKSKAKAGNRAKLGLSAKAGKRKLPTERGGKHVTTEECRKRDMWLHSIGLEPYERPLQWRPGEAA